MTPIIHPDVHKLTDVFIDVSEAATKAYELFCEKLHYDLKVYEKIAEILYMMAGDSDPPTVELTQILYFFQNLFFALREGDSSILTQARGLKVDRIVSVEEFVKSKDYMNQRRSIRPPVMKKLIELFHGPGSERYVEVVLGGGIGWGKNYFTDMAIGYMIYCLSCYHSPQLEFGLAPGSNIIFIMQSKKLELAKKVAFDQFGQRLQGSPYFTRFFPYNAKVKSEMRFPQNIIVLPISSTDTSALGMNVFGGLIDEMNFMAKVQNSVITAHTGEAVYDQAERLYTTAVRRMKSRYSVLGRVPGKLILISSANYPDAFIEKKIKEADKQKEEKGATSIFYVKYAQWETIPPDRISKERFLVEVGSDIKRSRIIRKVQEAVDPEDVIEVPTDYQSEFERDIDAALRDLAGIAISGKNVFIRQREKLAKAVQRHEELYEQQQLFNVDSIDLSRYNQNLAELINREYLGKIMDPNYSYTAHVDMSLTSDSCGLAFGHVLGYTKIGKVMNWDEAKQHYVEEAPREYPVIAIDGVIEIVPPAGDEIDLALVGQLVTTVAKVLNVRYCTADTFQSATVLQHVRKQKNVRGVRIKSGFLSVDTSLAPYAIVKQAIRDERWLVPNVQKMLKELREVELDVKRKKIDHPLNGSKDLSDVVTGVTYLLSLRKKTGAEEVSIHENEETGKINVGRRIIRTRRRR